MKADIKDKDKAGIYCIINKVNNKMYIGKAKCIHKRLIQHISHCNKKSLDENRHLIRAWHKYGRNNFSYFVLEYLELNESVLKERELYWQTIYNVTNKKFGYNFRLDSSTGMLIHKNTSKRISNNLKKQWKNGVRKEHGKKLSANWKTTPTRNKEQSQIMTKNLTKYKYILYNLNDIFIKTCTYKDLKNLKLHNCITDFSKKKVNKIKFKNYIIERVTIKDIV